jgi:hypothetical protein
LGIAGATSVEGMSITLGKVIAAEVLSERCSMKAAENTMLS